MLVDRMLSYTVRLILNPTSWAAICLTFEKYYLPKAYRCDVVLHITQISMINTIFSSMFHFMYTYTVYSHMLSFTEAFIQIAIHLFTQYSKYFTSISWQLLAYLPCTLNTQIINSKWTVGQNTYLQFFFIFYCFRLFWNTYFPISSVTTFFLFSLWNMK